MISVQKRSSALSTKDAIKEREDEKSAATALAARRQIFATMLICKSCQPLFTGSRSTYSAFNTRLWQSSRFFYPCDAFLALLVAARVRYVLRNHTRLLEDRARHRHRGHVDQSSLVCRLIRIALQCQPRANRLGAHSALRRMRELSCCQFS